MEYKLFKRILSDTIFTGYKAELLYKLMQNSERYIGLFRPTKPETKIIQNLLQSHEIRFGDAMESVLRKYLESIGYKDLENIRNNAQNINTDEKMDLDQLLERKGMILFIEQKVRDDHDSTKKRGQINNFEQKIDFLLKNYKRENINAYMYFIDSGLKKNKKFYNEQVANLRKKYKIEINVGYGDELFDILGHPEIFTEIESHLKKWRNELPSVPNSNFDANPTKTVEVVKKSLLSSDKNTLTENSLKKLFSDPKLFDLLNDTIFPTKESVKLLVKQSVLTDSSLIEILNNFSK
jgi:hypothetical protein